MMPLPGTHSLIPSVSPWTQKSPGLFLCFSHRRTGPKSHRPVVLACFLSGYLREYSSQWAHFLGQKITYIHFREKKGERNPITEPGSQCPEGILVACQPPSCPCLQAKAVRPPPLSAWELSPSS